MYSMTSQAFGITMRIVSTLFWREHYPLAWQKLAMNWISAAAAPGPKGVAYKKADAGGVPSCWVLPEGAKEDCVILYFHGGAYTTGSVGSHKKMAAWIARAAGCRALVADYRLAPRHRFPAALDDAFDAYRWLLNSGFKPKNIIMMGDSAGGGLAVAAAIRMRGYGTPLPAALVLLSPWTDLELTGRSVTAKRKDDPIVTTGWLRRAARMYTGKADMRNPLISPVRADLTGLPPMLIHVGDREILLDDSRRLARHAAQDGVECELKVWDGMYHVFQSLVPLVPESRESVRLLGAYCSRLMTGDSDR